MSYVETVKERRLKENQKKISERSFEAPIYTTGVAAEILGITPHTLRLYEKEGLILSHKTKTGRNLYSDLELEKVRAIRHMVQVEGFNFEGIRRLINMVPCWKIRGCTKEKWTVCRARQKMHYPCWVTKENCNAPLPSCRDCPVYQNLVDTDDIYSFINA